MFSNHSLLVAVESNRPSPRVSRRRRYSNSSREIQNQREDDSSPSHAYYSRIPVSTIPFILFIIMASKMFNLINLLLINYYLLLAYLKHSRTNSKLSYGHLQNSIKKWCIQSEDDDKWGASESKSLLDVQTLTNFPAEKLDGEFVILRFDSYLLWEPLDIYKFLRRRTLSTIRYLYSARAKILLISNWGKSGDPTLLSVESVAGYLSLLLQVRVVTAKGVSCSMQNKSENSNKADIILFENLIHFREELANCPVFSEKLSSGANIFVNDAFSLSHKILASTVGAARCCYACLAGFHFEEQLLQLKNICATTMQPYLVIVGGGRFLEKEAALSLLASICDGLIFVGMLSFEVMHALGISVPSRFLEHGTSSGVSKLMKLANSRGIPLCFPTDFWCVNDDNSEMFEIFPSERILPGWTPIDLGPMTLKEIYNFLFKCKKVLWIGPVKFTSSANDVVGASKLALMLERLGKNGCEITVAGHAACQAIMEANCSLSQFKCFENASVLWNFLKGKTLPGVAALDRVYPYEIDWVNIYEDPSQPLIVDIGSGNGLFSFKLAEKWKTSNFLGLEISSKLVMRCLDDIHGCNRKNVHFISTNATSTFRSIVSTYPGELILVSIQCPNPDFNRENHRRRMVQRALVEAIIDRLSPDAKVFLQSDIEAVTIRMEEQFIKYGKGRIIVEDNGEGNRWLPENPFEVRSDWEQRVLDRGGHMYRTMLRKVCNLCN